MKICFLIFGTYCVLVQGLFNYKEEEESLRAWKTKEIALLDLKLPVSKTCTLSHLLLPTTQATLPSPSRATVRSSNPQFPKAYTLLSSSLRIAVSSGHRDCKPA